MLSRSPLPSICPHADPSATVAAMSPPRRRLVALHLEPLEPRHCPAAIAQPMIDSVFVGAALPALEQEANVLVTDYVRSWGGYYGVGIGGVNAPLVIPSLGPSVVDYAPAGGRTPLQQTIAANIQAGLLPQQNGNQLVMVYPAPGESVEAPWGQWDDNPSAPFAGYHSTFTAPGGATIPYAVIVAQPTTDGEEYVAAHEFAEAVAGAEIADRYAWESATLDGFRVAVLEAPDGSRIEPPGPTQEQQALDLAALPAEQFWASAWGLLARIDPALEPYSSAAQAALDANPEANTPAGQVPRVEGELALLSFLHG